MGHIGAFLHRQHSSATSPSQAVRFPSITHTHTHTHTHLHTRTHSCCDPDPPVQSSNKLYVYLMSPGGDREVQLYLFAFPQRDVAEKLAVFFVSVELSENISGTEARKNEETSLV